MIYTIYNSAAISYTTRIRGVFDKKNLRLIPEHEKSMKKRKGFFFIAKSSFCFGEQSKKQKIKPTLNWVWAVYKGRLPQSSSLVFWKTVANQESFAQCN